MQRLSPVYAHRVRHGLIDTHEPVLAAVRAGKMEFHALGRGHYPGERLEAGELPGLLTTGFWDARGQQDWAMDIHRNEGVELSLLETGKMGFAVDGITTQLRPGDLTVTRPWQAHRQGHPTIAPGRLHWVTIDVRARRPDQDWRWPGWLLLSRADRVELTRRLRSTTTHVWRASPALIRHVRQLAEAVSGPELSRTSRVGIVLNQILLGLLDLLRAENPLEEPRLASSEHSVEIFLADLRTNLNALQESWTVPSMARACGMGATLFSRLCRRLTNESPMRVLNLARLDAGARLLREHRELSVLEIALHSGFQSSQYFAYQFHRRFGQTPTDYRAASAV